MKSIRCAVCVAGAVVVLLSGSLAQAGLTVMHEVTDSYNRDFGLLFTGTGNVTLGKNLALSLPQFDPSMGTLTGVNIMFNRTSESAAGSFKTTNPSTTDTAVFMYDFDRFESSPVYPGMITRPGTDDSAAPTTLAPEAMLTRSVSHLFGPGYSVDIDPSDFAAYIGGESVGTINTPSAHARVFVGDHILPMLEPTNQVGPDDLVTEGGLSFAVRTKVTYMYDAATTPEPVSAALGLMGLGALGVVTRRRGG